VSYTGTGERPLSLLKASPEADSPEVGQSSTFDEKHAHP